MSLLSAATIASLVALDESAMIDTVTITAVTQVSDGGGAHTETTSTTSTVGYFWTLNGDQLDGDQVREVGRHRLAIPKATSISGANRVTVNGNIYAIKYVFPLHAYSTSRMLGLAEWQGTAEEATPTTIPAGTWIGIGRIPTYAEDIAV